MIKIKVKSIYKAVKYLEMAYDKKISYDLRIGYDTVKGQPKSYYTVELGTDEETFNDLTGKRGLVKHEIIAKG
ncbi:MAG: hypothetical protein IJI67_06270 [Clostridia bacterium]|nr:hypothetical protein [Clostridia bacterium]